MLRCDVDDPMTEIIVDKIVDLVMAGASNDADRLAELVLLDLADDCQSAFNWDPGSATKRDPPFLRFERLALAPSELVRVAETGRARVVA
jgi:hypothetical protein